jgi:copper(I)-binding protein
MDFRFTFAVLATATALFAHIPAFAHDYQAGELWIGHPHARATVPGQTSGAAYLAIENKGKSADRLVAIASPVSKSVELHTMSMDGNIMKMREVQQIDIQPSGKILMTPGDGYHIMLIGLKQPLKIGDKFPLTLTFAKAGKTEVSVWVEELNGKGAKDAGQHHGH